VIGAEELTEGAWEDIARALRDYIGRRVGACEDRDDLVQDVLLRAYRGLNGLNDREAGGAWIYRIAHNAIVDHWRSEGRLSRVTAEEAHAAIAKLEAPSGDGERLQQSLADYVAGLVPSLPGPYRETLALTELEGCTNAEAARRLGVSLAAVKSRVLRGRRMLRERLARCCEVEVGTSGQVLDCTPRRKDDRAELRVREHAY
jgi:RNA polymerase sigma-70 factor, ECF subfamily